MDIILDDDLTPGRVANVAVFALVWLVVFAGMVLYNKGHITRDTERAIAVIGLASLIVQVGVEAYLRSGHRVTLPKPRDRRGFDVITRKKDK